jgi:hypothetical protein
VNSFLDKSLGLLEELADEKDVTGSSVTDDVVLGGGSSGNHGCSGMLNLLKLRFKKIWYHLSQENASVLGDLNLASASDKPKRVMMELS